MKGSSRRAEIRDLAPGLWIWRAEHPGWTPDSDWQPVATSTYAESRGERLVLDPLAPPPDVVEVWKRLDERPPTAALVLLPDHVRDIDLFVRLYGARPYGPMFFFPEDVPKSKLERIDGDTKLPGGLVALYDGRGRHFHLSQRYAANF